MNRRLKIWMTAIAAALAIGGCKDVVNPHMEPESDPSRLVAGMAATNQALLDRASAANNIVLTINNAPEANEPLEQDFLTELVELFEKRNPTIRINYSPWQYTPESFFERFNNRTLTDIVEVDAPQMVPIIENHAAADVTENIKVTPEMRVMNPDVFTVVSKDGRAYGMPTELHTMALFYNRRLFEDSKIVVSDLIKKPEDRPKGKGATGEPRAYVMEELMELPDKPPVQLAQYAQQQYYPPNYQTQQRNSARRSEREVQSYYNQRPNQRRQNQNQNRSQNQSDEQRRRQEYYRQYYQQYYQQYYGQYPQQQQMQQQEDARARRVKSRKKATEGESKYDLENGDSGTTSTFPDDTLTTEAELALKQQQTVSSDAVTSVIKTEGLPKDMEQFIRLAVRLTDHKKGIYGFAPVLYAEEGGREYSQWCMEAGLKMQTIEGQTVTLDVDQSGDVAQFLKDLHNRFDVMPEPGECYYDKLLGMFADGKLAMMILPADKDTIKELIKRGMSLNDIGITAMPRGIQNRDHLTYGKCLIINSQLDQPRRAAAFKWLMFMASPEVKRMRAKFFFGERELTAGPSVPLYTPTMQAEFYNSIRAYRSLPLWSDYESVVAPNIHLAPSFESDRFYEALAEGIRPIIENKNSDPFHAVSLITSDFERKYIRKEKPDNLLDRYVNYLVEKKTH